jgi:hypothetical protein
MGRPSSVCSHHAHAALGYEEVDRCVNYRKKSFELCLFHGGDPCPSVSVA